jgi:DNA-binding NtrC family response regulator
VDVRIIAATNRDLESALAAGRFREDLYFRLKVVTINLPPLRERPGDIPLLADYFLARFAKEMGLSNPGLTQDSLNLLKSHQWPGNVRELANVLQKALIFSRGYPIRPEDISQAIGGAEAAPKLDDFQAYETLRQWVRRVLLGGVSSDVFDSMMDRFASVLISEALELTGGNRSRAARLLGISRPTLLSKIERYNLKIETSIKSESS